MPIKSHPATGLVAPPFILLEGEENAGKSYAMAEFAGSDRIGSFYWFDLGEGTGEEYGPLGRGKIQVIDHDGTYRDIHEQLVEVTAEAKRARAAGEPPVGVGFDSLTLLWQMLVDWTNQRAMRSKNGERILAEDPDAEVDPTSNLWNDANDRHRTIVNLLQTFPGVAVATARGKMVTIGANGLPMAKPEWKTEGQKFLRADAKAIVRLAEWGTDARLMKAVSLNVERPKDGKGIALPDFTIEGLLDMLKVDLTLTRQLPRLQGDKVGELLAAVKHAETVDGLRDWWFPIAKQISQLEHAIVFPAVVERRAVLEAAAVRAKGEEPTPEQALAAAAAGPNAQGEYDPTLEPGWGEAKPAPEENGEGDQHPHPDSPAGQALQAQEDLEAAKRATRKRAQARRDTAAGPTPDGVHQ